MKKLNNYIIFLFLFSIACNKDKIPTSKNSSSSLNNLTENLKQELLEQLGHYPVTCRLLTTDLVLNSAGTHPIQVTIDSLFLDTLLFKLSNDKIYSLSVANKINENTIFLSSELLKNRYKSYFFIDSESNVIDYIDSSDSYMCKCDNNLSFKNDSIFYSYGIQYSDWYSVSCSGVK